MKKKKLLNLTGGLVLLLAVCALSVHLVAVLHVRNMPDSLTGLLDEVRKPQLKDRNGRPVTVTYANRWNCGAYVSLHQIPELLRTVFIESEDRRFYAHGGVDWLARLSAVFKNISVFKAARGASTITEQVVRMIHPRPRTVWSRYVEGCEARILEKKHSKDQILEFYLNQVPYASNRRGVVQAAEYYFNRSLDTLNLKEILALTVLVRAPSYFDPYRSEVLLEKPVAILADSLVSRGVISSEDIEILKKAKLVLEKPSLTVDAAHFAKFVYDEANKDFAGFNRKVIDTTLDLSLQADVEQLMDRALKNLSFKKVNNGACLVANHETGEILAWVSRAASDGKKSGMHIDGVTTARQPGSSLKPFLYALALEKGWTAAHEIEDMPLTNPVGRGLHTYHNYSRVFYGWVTVREALGNSLNIPAVKTIRFTGTSEYLARLKELGFRSLDRHPDYYGDGLALGSGEVTLFEMVQAYCALANRGVFIPLHAAGNPDFKQRSKKSVIFSEETASLIGNILSDKEARKLEFGGDGLLNFPVETAVKTGTSNDYRDSWAFGFNHRYVAGVWMGNLDSRPMDGVTGATGPAFVLRSVFSELNRKNDTRPLYFSPKLVKKEITLRSDISDEKDSTVKRYEWFKKDTKPDYRDHLKDKVHIGFIKPVNGLEMAMDPRIPDSDEAFRFELEGVEAEDTVVWIMNGSAIATTKGGSYLWHLEKGKHRVSARVEKKDGRKVHAGTVAFIVK